MFHIIKTLDGGEARLILTIQNTQDETLRWSRETYSFEFGAAGESGGFGVHYYSRVGVSQLLEQLGLAAISFRGIRRLDGPHKHLSRPHAHAYWLVTAAVRG